MKYSDKISQILDHFNLNKNSFSKEIGLSNNVTIGRIINENRKPSEKTINLIIKRFPQLNYDWILFGKGEMFNASHNISTLKDRLQSVLDDLGENPNSFAAKLGDKAEKYYKILDGTSKRMHPSTYNKIKKVFPSIDVDWLNTGAVEKNIKEGWSPKSMVVVPPQEVIKRMNNMEGKIDDLFKLDKIRADSLLKTKEEIIKLTGEIRRLKMRNIKRSS